MSTLPVLWLYGPPGVGKTTVSWELFVRLAQEGIGTGYVDIDQLGMCYAPPTPEHWAPEPADDPGRHRLKARALDAVVANFGDAGARCLLVPGVTDPVRGVETGFIPNAALTTCRLRAGPADLRRRLTSRGNPLDDPARELADAEALDRAFATDRHVDTTGLTVAEAADRVRARTGWPDRVRARTGWPDRGPARTGWPDLPGPIDGPSLAQPVPDPIPGEILWLCGPTAVGKSTVGWQVYQQVRRSGVNAAFVDLDQLGFHRPVPDSDPGNHRLKAANLAAVWRTFRAGGATCLIAVGPLERPSEVAAYTVALPAATITLCRLHAGPEMLADRVARRARGLTPTWGLAGDEIIGQPPARLREIAARAARTADALAGLGDLRVHTDDRPADEIAAQILRRTGWPSRPR
jgi:predicted ABC-type ATPase